MLVLSRKLGEEIMIGHQVRIRVVGVRGTRVQLAIKAPDSVQILRQEIYQKRAQFETLEPCTIPSEPATT